MLHSPFFVVHQLSDCSSNFSSHPNAAILDSFFKKA